MAVDWQALVAPSIVAPLVLAYACYRAVEVGPIKQKKEGALQPVTSQQKEEEEEEDNGIVTVSIVGAFCFVITASVFLVILFFFPKVMFYILRIMYGFAGSFATFNLFVPYVDAVFCRPPKCAFTIPWVGEFTVSQIILYIFCLGLVFAWGFTDHWIGNWILQDIISIGHCVLIISVYNIPNMKISAVLLVLAFFFDIFWVFGSVLIFKRSVMVEVATGNGGVPLPMLLRFGGGDGAPILGLGDIVLPGLFIAYTLKYDFFKSHSADFGYFYAQMVAYFLGVVGAYVASFVFEKGQPALMYIVPLCLTTASVQGLVRGHLKELWNGPPPVIKLLTDEEQHMCAPANESGEDNAEKA